MCYYHVHQEFDSPARPVRSHGGGYGWEDKSTVNLRLLLDFHQVWKESGGDKSTSLFSELILEELVFLHLKYYSIFLLQQEASDL
jgi:hypothetical protein